MSKFKVGDWVKLENWRDFYEIIDTTYCCVKLKIDYSYTDKWYDVNENVFIKKEETMKLEVGGKYRKVGTHDPVRVICTNRKSYETGKEFTCVSLVSHENTEYTVITTVEGKNLHGNVVIEEVPEVDWSNVPVDTPIWIVDGKNVHKRHFHKFENDYVYHWPDGKSSFTAGLTHFSYRNKSEDCYLENPNA